MKKNIIIVILTVLLLGLCGYFVFNSIIDKKETNNQEENNIKNDDSNQISVLNEKFKNLYAFKIDNDSIYALLTDDKEELLINYKSSICDNAECGKVKYEYIDGVLYLYHIGVEDSTYSVNEKETVDVYSIDLTKNEIKVTKEYEINKNGEYIDNIKQDNDSIYYVSGKYTNSYYNSKVFKFIKSTKQIEEVYDFNGAVNTDGYGVLAICNNNLYIVSDISFGNGYDGNQKIYSIDLDDNSVKTITENLFVSFYDSIDNKIISKVQGNKVLKIMNLKDLSVREVSENNFIENRYYSIGDKIVYYTYPNMVKIIGDKNYSIDLQNHINKEIKENYSYLVLWSDYSVVAVVYLEDEIYPEFYEISLNSGNVQKLEMSSEEIFNLKYLYIK